jgi:hypothetical protein
MDILFRHFAAKRFPTDFHYLPVAGPDEMRWKTAEQWARRGMNDHASR